MLPLSQQIASSTVISASTGSSAPATPLTTHATHTAAMPLFFMMNTPWTPSPAFLPACPQMFPYPVLLFSPFYPTLPQTALPSTPTATSLPAASSPPVSGASSSSSSTADMFKQTPQPLSSLLRSKAGRRSQVFTPQEDDLLLQLYIDSSKSWRKEAQEKFAYKNLTLRQLENRITRIKSLSQVSKSKTKNLNIATKSPIHHVKDAIVKGREKNSWTALERKQLYDIFKDRTRYASEGTSWRSVAKQTLNRTESSITQYLTKMRKENPEL